MVWHVAGVRIMTCGEWNWYDKTIRMHETTYAIGYLRITFKGGVDRFFGG